MSIYPVFLGVAEHTDPDSQPLESSSRLESFAVNLPVDIFQISSIKPHLIFPITIETNAWAFMLSPEFLKSNKALDISIHERNGLSKFDFKANSDPQTIPLEFETPLFMFIKLKTIVERPGVYDIYFNTENENIKIGAIDFFYTPADPLTQDVISAIEADPNAPKYVVIELGCRHCDKKMSAYSGLKRSEKIESEGKIWQYDLPQDFKCACGKTHYDLKYLKESLHGVLLNAKENLGLDYVRQYGHQQILSLVNAFKDLLRIQTLEEPIQKFIEQNLVLLSCFNPQRLFLKPNILGKFKADFVILDSKKQLWFIEIEKPSIKLFGKEGHPSQSLMHAYHQVNDWLHEFTKHRGAILESLKLKETDVLSIKGAVIAGTENRTTFSHLQRHFSKPPFPNIEFMTFDDLWKTLLETSRKLS